MRILIAYAGNNDTTKYCANVLKGKLPDSDTINLVKHEPDISDYDTIIIGSCIRFNEIHPAVKNFIGNNIDVLLEKNTAIFLCCGFPEKANQYLLHNLPKKLLDKAVAIECFGGRLRVKSYKIFDKLVIKTVQKNFKIEERDYTEIIEENIESMADKILNLNK